MPVIFEPTLVKASYIEGLNNTGGNHEVEWDFGINEGAKIEKVVITPAQSQGVAGTMEAGLNFRPNAGSPAASGDIFQDDDVFCSAMSLACVAAGSYSNVVFDFQKDSIYVVKDITGQYFSSGASNKAAYIKIYYKRCRFSDAEMGNLLRNY